MLQWGKVYIPRRELCLANVLQAGQAFRWILNEKTEEYSTTMKIANSPDYSIVMLRQHDDSFIEILGQEPWETLVSFICSTNNNISRITKMCHALCTNYGKMIGNLGSTEYYSFPSSEDLVENATEHELRELGFGYRAKYIIDTASKMVEDKKHYDNCSDTEFLTKLAKSNDYDGLREQLMSYSGIGPKVADCICLMGMKKDEVVPVDVHVARIAERDYKIRATNTDLLKLKELYKEQPITRKKVNLQLDFIRRKLHTQWGSYAGWAQGILFFREVGGTSGANTTGKIKKRKNEEESVKVEVNEQEHNDIIHKTKRSRVKSEQTN
ncbi:8-oxoguanine glycosylase ogg1 [Maudiozyma exigua]|uniref:N-glycosylase/DNA lyase n=1 Tax=Maudiozyma exigua TaxID=34358 RepID=A0A9P6WFB3_MAUEX|nr:8-oxoguanine glycosylase ogg1 [Kazachstania exigua]